ncbi:MAG: glycosyltransferase family 2 protein [Sulfurovum sp.]|nr:glycosyltransferase family 2 protein [Sulfurovum sp.]
MVFTGVEMKIINNKLVSICIPSYNRPKELYRLLESIDSQQIDKIEIIICEDKSLHREEITKVVHHFMSESTYEVKYFENNSNLGYDKNLKELISKANGNFVVFMGDDDTFIPQVLDKLISFLEDHTNIGYVLKSHQYIFKDGRIEKFRYFDSNQLFSKGEETYVQLFRKSVFLSGFIINRHYIQDLLIDDFDGTLLFQLYLLAEVSLQYDCAYFDVPLTQAKEEGLPFFGNSESEKALYTPGVITIENSINFLKGFVQITSFIDTKYHLKSTPKIKRDMSKYFYHNLSIQRDKGLKEFFRYISELNKLGFNITIYYYIYLISLTLFGKKICDSIIVFLKRILGKTPKL